MSMRFIGRSVPRLEDRALLRGQARFVDDIRLPDTLNVAFVRSPHGHALIRGIDGATARTMPGVVAVFTHRDLSPRLISDRLAPPIPAKYLQNVHRQVLAADEVVHVGECVALVVAADRYLAEDAASLVEVDYEPLPAIGNCRDALALGAPTAHRTSPDNLVTEFRMAYGEVAKTFASSPHVFRDSFWQHRGGGHSMEGRGTLASYDTATDRLTLWTSTQVPHGVRRALSDVLGRDEEDIHVIAPEVGGAFGVKLVVYPEDICVAVASMLLGRPVKWIEDRREHFVASIQERDQYWEMEVAVDDDGRLQGVRGMMIHDHGAYTARGTTVAYGAAASLTLAYEVPCYQLDVRLALTNKVPVSPLRGAGQPQGVFAMEHMLDLVARGLGIDRAEIRRRNLVSHESMPREKPLVTRGGVKVLLDGGDYPEGQEEVLRRVGWEGFPERQRQALQSGRYIGIGIANYVEATGRGPFEPVTVRITASGKVVVATGAVALGQGTRTMLAQLVAEQLGQELEAVGITTGDTGAISIGFGAFNSRQAVTAGTSAYLAACKVRDKALRIAAHMLEAAPVDLEIAGPQVRVKGTPQMSVTLRDVARLAGGTPGFVLPEGVTPGLEATESFVVNEMAYTHGTAVAEVEVDIETGGVSVSKFVLAHDCGRILHPAIVDGQLIGGIAHGIGNALFEWMGFDSDCQPVTTNFGEYLLIGATEMPKIELIHRETPTTLNPLGIKGVGESGVIPAPAAIVSAIEDALAPFKVRVNRVPISPPELLALIAAGR